MVQSSTNDSSVPKEISDIVARRLGKMMARVDLLVDRQDDEAEACFKTLVECIVARADKAPNEDGRDVYTLRGMHHLIDGYDALRVLLEQAKTAAIVAWEENR